LKLGAFKLWVNWIRELVEPHLGGQARRHAAELLDDSREHLARLAQRHAVHRGDQGVAGTS
jgi:hypothetical protein